MKKYGIKAIEKAKLEIWDNPEKRNNYLIEITFPELSCICPRSGYPDYATINIIYIPKDKIVELKSLKLYLNKFRNEPISHEAITNKIFNDLKKTLKPKYLKIVCDFHPRGNVKTVVTTSTDEKDYTKHSK